MSKELLMSGKAVNAELETTLAIESFLKENFLFRRNVLNGKVEFAIKPSEEATNDDGKEEPFPDFVNASPCLIRD